MVFLHDYISRLIFNAYYENGIHPYGRVRSAEGFISPHSTLLCSEIGGFAADRGSYTSPATACAVYPFVYLPEANTLRCKLFTSDKSE